MVHKALQQENTSRASYPDTPFGDYVQINIVKIEAYEYTDAPGIKHLFLYFAEDSKKAIPYFMPDNDIWEQIQLYIIQAAK